MGEHDLAEKYLRKLLKLKVKSSGEESMDVADDLSVLGDILRSQGKYAQAVSLFEKAVFIKSRL